jgi:hypothetical protein
MHMEGNFFYFEFSPTVCFSVDISTANVLYCVLKLLQHDIQTKHI